jgi:dipeptidyl aminopeptidase/acylaminoacyl peptidase
MDLWAISPSGTGLRQLTTDPADDTFPRWSPDGTKLTFTTERAGSLDVAVMNADGTNQVVLTAGAVGDDELGDWQPKHAFVDVAPMNIFHHNIESIAAVGITRGCNPPANTMYCPDSFVTRGQMAAFLVRALGYTDDGGGDLFIDDDDSIFEGDIDRLGTAGVTKGCNPPANNRYCPTGFVTRGQMAAFLHRALD